MGINLKAEDLVDSFHKQAENFTEFLALIPWREEWIIAVMLFHLSCLLCILLTRSYYNVQYIVFFLLLVLVYCTESINMYAAKHWKVYSKENYFDSNGLFISTIFAAPILINCVVLIVFWLGTAGKTLIDIKKREIGRVKKKEVVEDTDEDPGKSEETEESEESEETEETEETKKTK